VHREGATDSSDAIPIDVTWDDVSEGDYEAIFGYMPGVTPELDRYLFPTDDMLEDFSHHYYREWNLFCDNMYRHLKNELNGGRGKALTKGEWEHYFQSSNRGKLKPAMVADRRFIEEGLARIKEAMQYRLWNKRRLRDLVEDLPHQLALDFQPKS
jgi:hypothetical protein